VLSPGLIFDVKEILAPVGAQQKKFMYNLTVRKNSMPQKIAQLC